MWQLQNMMTLELDPQPMTYEEAVAERDRRDANHYIIAYAESFEDRMWLQNVVRGGVWNNCN